MKQKQTLKLNESQLRQIIKESIKNVLKENWEDAGNAWAEKQIANDFDVNPDGPGNENIKEEIRLYNEFKNKFEEKFGAGSFEKARKASLLTRFNPFAGDAEKAYDEWNRNV